MSKMIKAIVAAYHELPEDLQKEYVHSHCDYFILVYHRGELVFHACDNMEPEDATFCRDLSWISDVVEKAYKLGLKDGNSLDYLE